MAVFFMNRILLSARFFCKFTVLIFYDMNITIEKQNLLQWIQGLTDEKIIERILSIKENDEVSTLENQLIQKGLEDISNGNLSNHEEVKKRFEAKFAKK